MRMVCVAHECSAQILGFSISGGYIKEEYCAVALVLELVGLRLLNGAVALYLPIFLPSVFA